MTTWGTAKSLFARFEVGQNWEDLLVKFEVGQGSRDLEAVLVVQGSNSADLSAKTRIYRVGSAETYAHFIIKTADSTEIYGHAEIQHPDSADLYASFYRGGESLQNLYSNTEIRHPDSAELYAKLDVEPLQSSANLYGQVSVRHPTSQNLSARFDIGKGPGSQDLLVRFEVGQGAVDLLGVFELVNVASQDLLVKVVITHSVELYAKFSVSRQGDVQDLPAFFSVGQNSEDLWGSTIVQQSVQLNLYSAFVVRHPGTPVELYAHAIIRQPASAEAYAHLVIKNTGSAELFCSFTTQNIADLYAKVVVGLPEDSDAYIVCNNPASWINVVTGIGEGFITMPWVEADTIVKMCGNSSARLTSKYTPGQYKEIRFGWNGVCLGGADLRRQVPEQSFKELDAKFYVMSNVVDFDNWLDLGFPGGWYEEDFGAQGQTNPQPDHLEVVMFNNMDIEDNLGGLWHFLGTMKTYLGGTIVFDIEFENPYTPGGGLSGTQPYIGFTASRYMSYGRYGAIIYYKSTDDTWHFVVTNEDGVTDIDITADIVDFEARHIYKIIWETPSQYPTTGRVRLYIDDVLKQTVTTNVMEDRCQFGFGADADRLGAKTRSGVKLYGYSDA